VEEEATAEEATEEVTAEVTVEVTAEVTAEATAEEVTFLLFTQHIQEEIIQAMGTLDLRLILPSTMVRKKI
jgi:hypothetical protein